MLRIKYDEAISETSAQRGAARALIDQSVMWGLSFDGSFMFQFGFAETAYTVVLNGSGLVYDDISGSFSDGIVTGIDLNVSGAASASITDFSVDATVLQGYIDAALAAGGKLGKITNPLFNSSPQRVVGSSGNDTLEGGNRTDVILGKDGDDTIVATKGNDKINGGEGEDLVLYEDMNPFGGVTVNLAEGTASVGQAGFLDQVLASIECVAGTKNADSLVGDGGNNCFFGLAGNDRIQGLAGTDRLYGEGGNDWIVGGPDRDFIYGDAGRDEIEGSGGDDVIRGGGQNDLITGGRGDDVLFGGSGADSFYFDDSPGTRDIIKDFSAGDAVIIEFVEPFGYEVDSSGSNTIIRYAQNIIDPLNISIVLKNVMAGDIAFVEDVDGVTFFIA